MFSVFQGGLFPQVVNQLRKLNIKRRMFSFNVVVLSPGSSAGRAAALYQLDENLVKFAGKPQVAGSNPARGYLIYYF